MTNFAHLRNALAMPLMCAALSAFAEPSTTPSETRFSKRAWLDDYASLKQQLERQYANLAWFASTSSPLDLPALERRTRLLLTNAKSDQEARTAISSFIASFHDGHLRQLEEPMPALPNAAPEPALPQPLGFTSAAQACAAIGIDHGNSVAYSLPIESLPGFALQADGITDPFRTGVLTMASGLQIGVLRIPRFREREYPPICRMTWDEAKQSGATMSGAAFQRKIEARWLAELSAQLGRLKAQKIAALLIDIGGNGGGNDTGDWAVRLFTRQAVRSAPLFLTTAKFSIGYFDDQVSELAATKSMGVNEALPLRRAVTESIRDYETKKKALQTASCDMSWVWKQKRPWDPGACSLIPAGYSSGATSHLEPVPVELKDFAQHYFWPAVTDPYRGSWTGPVYILTDNKVYSSAEMFAAEMRDNRIAKTIGAATGGAGCGNMQKAQVIRLPHSGLRFQAPDCLRLRLDGSNEVSGIIPDLPVLKTEGESERRRAARVASVIEADLDSAGKLARGVRQE